MTDGTEESARRGPAIDWPATMAGAGAAVTVAVLLSTLGAAGTLIGAALGSVIATVSTALYKQGIESSRRRVAEVQAAALERDAARAHRHLGAADADPKAHEEAAEPTDADGRRWAALPWKRIALLAALVFVIAVVVISAVELIAGRSVSSLTGGTDGKDRTSISGFLGDSDDGDDGGKRKQKDTPSDDAPTSTPTDSGTPSDAATDPSSSAAPSESDPPSPTPTDTASEEPQPTPTESTSPPGAQP